MHEDLEEVTEIKKNKTRIKVFKCKKCGEVEAILQRVQKVDVAS